MRGDSGASVHAGLNVIRKHDAHGDRHAIFDYVAADNPLAAVELDERFSRIAIKLETTPYSGREGRFTGTKELVAHANYILVYSIQRDEVWILHVLHAARR